MTDLEKVMEILDFQEKDKDTAEKVLAVLTELNFESIDEAIDWADSILHAPA